MVIFKGLNDSWNENLGLQVSTTHVFDLYVTIIRYNIRFIFINV